MPSTQAKKRKMQGSLQVGKQVSQIMTSDLTGSRNNRRNLNGFSFPLPFSRIRAMGSCTLNMCHVAMGGVDVCFEFGIHAWDLAAGYLVVTEAGGVVVDTEGRFVFISCSP